MKGTDTIFFILIVLTVYLQNVESAKMSLEEIKEALVPLRKHCMDRVGTDPKMIDNANKGNFVSDWRLQCYYKCMLMNAKVIKDDKIVALALQNIAKLMVLDEYIKPMTKAVMHCLPTLRNFKGCELAYNFAKCYYEFDSSGVPKFEDNVITA